MGNKETKQIITKITVTVMILSQRKITVNRESLLMCQGKLLCRKDFFRLQPEESAGLTQAVISAL